MSKKNSNEIKIGYKELQEGCPIGTTALDMKNTPIPIESLKVLMTGDSNDKFRVISKKISSENVKLILKHRETKERVKIVAPIQFLEFHKVQCEIIIKDLSQQFDLVVVVDKESQKRIACKVPIKDIEQTKLYIEKCQTYKQANTFDYSKIHIWRENEWQKEIMTKINLLKLTHSQILPKV